MSSKKSSLGRGLSALLASNNTEVNSAKTNETPNPSGSVTTINIADIEVNPFQPRTQFDQQALEELAASIKELGLIQAVTVRKLGYGKYQLISGERRFRASQLAGLTKIPAFIRVANDQQMLEMALVENIQRENLDAIEIAISYKRLIDECNLTQEEMSDRVGKQRSTVANYLRLLKLPAEIQLAIRKGVLSMGQARAIVNIDDEEAQLKLFADIVKNGLSVRQVEELVKGVNKITGASKKAGNPKAPLAYHLQKVSNELIGRLNTKVEIKRQSSGKGNIIIPFSSDNDLERIVKLLNHKD